MGVIVVMLWAVQFVMECDIYTNVARHFFNGVCVAFVNELGHCCDFAGQCARQCVVYA